MPGKVIVAGAALAAGLAPTACGSGRESRRIGRAG